MSDIIEIRDEHGNPLAIPTDTGYEEEMIRLRRRLAEATLLLADIERDSAVNPLGFHTISVAKLRRVRRFLVSEARDGSNPTG